MFTIKHGIEHQTATYSGCIFREGLLFFKGILVIPYDTPVCIRLLKEFHCSPIGEHAWIACTFCHLSSIFYWHYMRREMQLLWLFVKCVNKWSTWIAALHALILQSLPIPNVVFEKIAMDFITCLPSSKGKATIMTILDRLSKYGHFIPLSSTFTTHYVALAFVANIIELHGPPRVIVTDREPRFIHSIWQEINWLQGTTLAMSTTYHPQTDGQSEALNKCIEHYMRCFISESPHEWVTILPWIEFR